MKSFGTQFLNRDACLFRVAQKKCFLNQTCNSRQRYEVSQCFIQSLYWCGIHVKYMYHAASNSGGWAGVPIKNFVFAPCMAVRERGAAAVHQNLILGLPRKTGWVHKILFAWCSGFLTGICFIIWFCLVYAF